MLGGLTVTGRADGVFRFQWTPVSAPDLTYAVVFYGADMQEVARVEAGQGSTLDVVPTTVASGMPVTKLWWAVSVTRLGDELGVTRLRAVVGP